MSSKQDMIKQMLDMQKKFMEYEHEHGVQSAEYWGEVDASHPLHGYRAKYEELATKVVDMAHADKKSKR